MPETIKNTSGRPDEEPILPRALTPDVVSIEEVVDAILDVVDTAVLIHLSPKLYKSSMLVIPYFTDSHDGHSFLQWADHTRKIPYRPPCPSLGGLLNVFVPTKLFPHAYTSTIHLLPASRLSH